MSSTYSPLTSYGVSPAYLQRQYNLALERNPASLVNSSVNTRVPSTYKPPSLGQQALNTASNLVSKSRGIGALSAVPGLLASLTNPAFLGVAGITTNGPDGQPIATGNAVGHLVRSLLGNQINNTPPFSQGEFIPPPFQGGQSEGVLYGGVVTWYSNGNQNGPSEYVEGIGPIRLVSLDGAGGPGSTGKGFKDSRNVTISGRVTSTGGSFTYDLNGWWRVDSQPDTGGNPDPVSIPTIISQPTPNQYTNTDDSPATRNFYGEPQTIPKTDPSPTKEGNPGEDLNEDQSSEQEEAKKSNPLLDPRVGLALTAGTLISGLLNRGRTPTSTGQGGKYNGPPLNIATNNNCGCNAGIEQALKNNLRNSNAALDALNAAQLGEVLNKLNAMQTFAEKAWQNTRLQKLINLLTLIGVLHNAAMLSREVGETLGYVLSNALAIVGIKDENGSALDINELVGQSVRSWIESVVGAEAYAKVINNWQKANRVYQSAANVVWTLRNIQDSTQEVAEWIAENTGRIGNALKKYGVVGERAYPWMAERVRAQDVWRRKLDKVFRGLEDLDDTASSIYAVTSEVREIQEEFTELNEAKTRFEDSLSDFLVDEPQPPPASPDFNPIGAENAQARIDSESPDLSLADAAKGDTQSP